MVKEIKESEKKRNVVLRHGRAIQGANALHDVGHITPEERDKHISASQKVIASTKTATPTKTATATTKKAK